MKLPYVSRVAFEAAIGRADAHCQESNNLRVEVQEARNESIRSGNERDALHSERAIASAEIDKLRGCNARLSESLHQSQNREAAVLYEKKRALDESSHVVGMYSALLDEEKRRYNALLDKYHEATSRTADLAELAIKPAPITVTQPDAKFEDFPPDVAVALTYATQGYKPDEARNIHNWTRAELASGKSAEAVALSLRVGLPVSIDMEEAH